jgi:hypothetical protein
MANNININNPMGVKPQQKKGSGFTNLNKIIGANQNNQLAANVAKGVGQGAQQVQQGIGQVKSQFQQQADANNLASDVNKTAASQALSNIMGGNTDVSDQQANQFGTFLAGKYAGPQELDATKTAQVGARAREVQGFGQALGSGGDKTGVLQAFAGKGPYSAGQQRLDSLLLGKGPGAGKQLAQARQQSAGLTGQVGREQEIAQQIGQLRSGQAAQFGKDVSGQIGGAKTGLETTIGGEFTRLEGQQKQLYDAVKAKFESGEALSPEERQTLGLGDPTGNITNKMPGLPGSQAAPIDIYNLKAQDYLQKAALDKGSVATAQQKAQLEALSKLGQKDIKDFTDVNTKAGQYDPNKPLEFNLAKLKADADIKKQGYDSELNRSLGLTLGQQLEDAPSSVWGLVGDAAGTMTMGLGHAIDAFVTGDPSKFNLYEYKDTLGGMPDIGSMNYQQAVNAVNAYESKIRPFMDRVEKGHPDDGGRQSKTKENNLRGAYDTIVPRLQAVKQQLAEYKKNLDTQYGIGRKI